MESLKVKKLRDFCEIRRAVQSSELRVENSF